MTDGHPVNEQQAMHNVSESSPCEAEKTGHGEAPPIQVDTESRLGRTPMVLLVLALCAIAFLIIKGIHRRSSSETVLARTTEAAAVESVNVVTPTTGAKAQELVLPANAQAFIDTAIYSRTSGYLLKWYADIGARVRKGALLAVIQTPELDQQVEQAKADVATAESNEKIAEITANRWKNLLAKNAVSHQEADQALSDLTARQSALNSSRANLSRLRQLQNFERIYAPFDGIITARNVDIGSLVQAGDSRTPHSELFHISAIGTLRLFVPVPEIYASIPRNGATVKVTSDSYPNESFTGTIVRNSTAIDPSSRTLNVEVDLPNTDHKMLPGQYAFVHLPIPPGNQSLTLPSNTLLFRAEGLRVAVVRGDHAHLVPVTIGHDYGATVEIRGGLEPNDKVIQNPSDSLLDGAQVRLEAK